MSSVNPKHASAGLISIGVAGFDLEALGARTSVAYDGEEALAIAATVHPSVGILDIGMPGMDGCELARRLRADPELAGAARQLRSGEGCDESYCEG
jgi:CheY-like chemotaxis protein